MKNYQKLIAEIYEEDKVFLTNDGRYYAYGRVEGKLQLSKMNALAIQLFLQRRRTEEEKSLVIWSPVVINQPLTQYLVGSRVSTNLNQRSF